MKSIEALLRKLTTDDLCGWAGETIVNRGRGYLQRVDQLARTGHNTLAAWVTGTDRYATSSATTLRRPEPSFNLLQEITAMANAHGTCFGARMFANPHVYNVTRSALESFSVAPRSPVKHAEHLQN